MHIQGRGIEKRNHSIKELLLLTSQQCEPTAVAMLEWMSPSRRASIEARREDNAGKLPDGAPEAAGWVGGPAAVGGAAGSAGEGDRARLLHRWDGEGIDLRESPTVISATLGARTSHVEALTGGRWGSHSACDS